MRSYNLYHNRWVHQTAVDDAVVETKGSTAMLDDLQTETAAVAADVVDAEPLIDAALVAAAGIVDSMKMDAVDGRSDEEIDVMKHLVENDSWE